jgi:hypothetical protein
LQLAKTAKAEEASQVQTLQLQLQALQEEQIRRQAQEAEVSALKAQLLKLQTKTVELDGVEVLVAAPPATTPATAPTTTPASTSDAALAARKEKTGRYVAEINKLKDKISNMKVSRKISKCSLFTGRRSTLVKVAVVGSQLKLMVLMTAVQQCRSNGF